MNAARVDPYIFHMDMDISRVSRVIMWTSKSSVNTGGAVLIGRLIAGQNMIRASYGQVDHD